MIAINQSSSRSEFDGLVRASTNPCVWRQGVCSLASSGIGSWDFNRADARNGRDLERRSRSALCQREIWDHGREQCGTQVCSELQGQRAVSIWHAFDAALHWQESN